MTDIEQNSSSARRAIVVGIDGSDGSRAALEHALDEGTWRDLPVRAVMAYGGADVWTTEEGGFPDARTLHDAAGRAASSQVDAVVEARRSRGESVPAVDVEVVMGPAPAVLERQSKDAAMLVVGHRGRGGVASRLIGSVGLSAVVHAECTVVVIRD